MPIGSAKMYSTGLLRVKVQVAVCPPVTDDGVIVML